MAAVKCEEPVNPVVMYTKNDGNYMDVIPYDNRLICYAQTGIIIYDATDLRNVTKVGMVNY